ncbi:PREDICTED: uncharacterized protein LOC104825281 [Tarenaya hassleriana]|uniref:uncharacterized protein LOC104825281 n=1 Tax=Tarenaya hassleriana TaxID=28532 RepID=UPI00053C1240|nr:PREDICTED: uncharacterized protein LOC104825281 [Tarenaya hassleriana]
MASSGSSDEDFRSRVEKIFGSLAFSRSPSSPSPASLWSLTDGDVKKREWKRDKSASYDRDEIPCASSFDELLKQQRGSRNARKQFEDELGEDGDDGRVRGEDDEFGDEWSIRASIGLDRTLDNEEEEDEYDKVALGRENAGERLYMKDVTDLGSSLGSWDTLAKSSGKMTRDPRAIHFAAKLRLKEDKAEIEKFSPSHNHSSGRREPHGESSKEDVAPKPILKRKDSSSEARASKRVRFDLGAQNDVEATTAMSEDISASPCSDNSASESTSHLGKSGSQIPDYLINPSRYTCYSCDSCIDADEKPTTQEYMDLPKFVEESKASESESMESPSANDLKKVTFIPQKRAKNISKDNNSSEVNGSSEEKELETTNQAIATMGIAAGEVEEEDGLDAMENEDPEIGKKEKRCTGSRRPDRRYRAKRSSDETDA